MLVTVSVLDAKSCGAETVPELVTSPHTTLPARGREGAVQALAVQRARGGRTGDRQRHLAQGGQRDVVRPSVEEFVLQQQRRGRRVLRLRRAGLQGCVQDLEAVDVHRSCRLVGQARRLEVRAEVQLRNSVGRHGEVHLGRAPGLVAREAAVQWVVDVVGL